MVVVSESVLWSGAITWVIEFITDEIVESENREVEVDMDGILGRVLGSIY